MVSQSRMFHVAMCGATGAVGQEVLKILEQRRFPVARMKLLASSRSAGKRLKFAGESLEVEELKEDSFKGVELALFAAGGEISKRFAPLAASDGCVVIDKSSAFRTHPEVPLVIPEINPEDIADYRAMGIISSPNCSTTPLALALKPLDVAARVRRVVVTTFQSVSGAGNKGVDELLRQIKNWQNSEPVSAQCFSKPIAFNCLPHIDSFLPDGYTKEERKMQDETRRILHRPDISVTATTVRVPVFRSHALAANVQLERKLSAVEARTLLSQAPGIQVVDHPAENQYPTPLDAAEGDLTLVGRIREDSTIKYGLDLWAVTDNLRKGAALNAVQIAERLITDYL